MQSEDIERLRAGVSEPPVRDTARLEAIKWYWKSHGRWRHIPAIIRGTLLHRIAVSHAVTK